MASGDTLFILTPQSSVPPAPGGDNLNPAALDVIADGSSPSMNIPCLAFDGALDEHADWLVTIPSHYSDTIGFTFSYKYAMSSTDGNIVEMEFRALHIDDTTVLSGDLGIDTQTETTITDDPAATADDLNYSAIGTMAKANFGGAVAGDLLCIRATRDESAYTNVDDLQLLEILVTET